MIHCCVKHSSMGKENTGSQLENPPMRVTRARARSLGQSGGLPPLHPTTKQDDKRLLRSNFKRAASNENKIPSHTVATCHHNKRAPLEDVTNVISGSDYQNCTNATKIQNKLSRKDKKEPLKRSAEVVPNVLQENPGVGKKKAVDQTGKKKQKTEEEISLSDKSGAPVSFESTDFSSVTKFCVPDTLPIKHNYCKNVQLQSLSKHGKSMFYKEEELSDGLGILNIDSKHKDPLMCTVYAPIIYEKMKAMELDRRPSTHYLENVQQVITASMRGILIDWLAEVSEEYKLIPDTLYLTVNLIDRFLSGNDVQRQKLQLLGVTCMLIASKYEEICAPHVEDFCFITDNTYTKEEVVKMESRVLNFVGFQVSVPTTKKFLRRFVQAGQVSFKVPSVELEYLANYLAELTLMDYSFLKLLPSLIAASAVFLAKWILDQSCHPWNPTLEYYTSYNTTELKTTVLALQDLHLNTSGCTLHVIRAKYKQEKFKSVANLSSSKPVQSLF